MSYSPMDSVEAVPQEGYRRDESLQLTPEEIQILKDCSREGIVSRAIPMGLIFGLGGLFSAKAGPLMSTRFGVKPAVIGLGFFGYFMGRFSYSGICFDRALQVPNGTLRKLYSQKKAAREYMDPSENYYANIEPKHDPGFSSPSLNSDIDIPSTSSFDTVPSDYYSGNVEAPKEDVPQNYTSYDDLRRQNREEYSKKMFNDTVRRSGPQEGVVRRPPPMQDQNSEQPRGIKTKYGDTWDA